jgi:GNAT superfamily N-acetyltransferase
VKAPSGQGAGIRRVGGEDVEALLGLLAEHAAFERAPAPPVQAATLAAALSGPRPALMAWLACAGGQALGYLSATRDFSTWRGRPYLHMDCLYLRPQARGRGLGARLLAAVCRHAREQGIDQMQWQTPDWNHPAERFYLRQGAQVCSKRRFVLELG